ncbi:MAG: DUF4292 domain-containing protein [Bacteroidota bacterium]|nr:DUF4292 domain-containing protein [Bacteroidota bacterium]
MKTTYKAYSFLYSVLLLIIFQGCSTKKNLVNDFPIAGIEISEIIKNSRKTDFTYENLRNRVKVEFDNGRVTQNIILSFRAIEDEVLWLSASMIVPIAKILMTNERFVFYEKFQKNYVDEDLSQLSKLLNLKNPVNFLQNILFGSPVIDINKVKWEKIQNSNYYVLQSSKEIQTTLFINPKTFQLEQQRIFIPLLSSLVTFNYRNYKNIDGKTVPSDVLISYIKGNQITKINLEYSQFDFPENLNFPMEIPSDYKLLTLDEIIK